MEKKILKILIKGKTGFLKKLQINTPISHLRKLFSNEITDNYYFKGPDGLKVMKQDEEEFTIKDIVVNGNQIIIDLDISSKILIYLDSKEIEQIENCGNITLNELRKKSKKISDEYCFILNEGEGILKIDEEDENDLKVNDIINQDIVNIQRKIEKNKMNDKTKKNINNDQNKNDESHDKNIIKKIYIMNGKDKILELNHIKSDLNLSALRDLFENKIPDDSSFFFLGNKLEKLKENEILVRNILDKNNCIYLIIGNKIKDINEDLNNGKDNEENVNKDLNKFLNLIESFSSFFGNYELSSKDKANIIQIQNECECFKKKYSKFKGLKRFSIPVFGIISSGKSTLLNYLLNLNDILEMDQDISTQFICIIRNKKGLKNPKLYKVKLSLRDGKFVNFEKDAEIQGDIKSIISDKNKDIKCRTREVGANPEDYFLLIETHIPFLNNLEKEYSDLFEFLDFPGLNENNRYNKVDLLFKNYLPLVLPNTFFSIFIFEVFKFEGNESKDILNFYQNFGDDFNYLKEISRKSFEESIFILNKIDLIKEKEEVDKQLNIFRKKFGLKNNNSLCFSSLDNLQENNKFNSFYQFIEFILEDNTPHSINFIENLEYKMEKELKIKEIKYLLKNIEKNEKLDDESELKKINDLIYENANFNFTFKSEQYLAYKNLFMNNIPKEKIFKENKLTNLLKTKIIDIYNDYTNLDQFPISLKLIKENENNNNNFIWLMKEVYTYLFVKNQKVYSPSQLVEIAKKFDSFADIFLSISKDSKILKDAKIQSQDLLNFINSNKISFKILTLGKYSSGKSSLLNSIIGYNLNLLNTSSNECTKKAFVIKYCKSLEDISLIKSKKKQNDFNFYYFEEKEIIAKGIIDVRRKIIELNEGSNYNNFEYYIIKTPIEIFDNLNLEECKNYLELIDLPGFDISGYSEIIFGSEKMINFMNGLIYVNNGGNLENNQNNKAIEILISLIREYKANFSFKSILFTYTHADEGLSRVKELYNKVINFFNDILTQQSLIDRVRQDEIIRDKNEILVTKFSNTIYKEYQDIIHYNIKSNSFEDLKQKLENNYLDVNLDIKDKFNEYQPNKEKLKEAKTTIMKKFGFSDSQKKDRKRDFHNKDEELRGFLNNNQNINDKEKEIEYISKLYLFIIENIKEWPKYRKSNAEHFFKTFQSLINNTKKNYYEELTINFKKIFLEKIYHRIIMLKLFVYKEKQIFISKEEVDKKKHNIYKYGFECSEKIEEIFKQYLDDIRNLINEFLNFHGREERNFDDRVKELENNLEQKKNIFEKQLKKNISLFISKCFNEIEHFQNDILGEVNDNGFLNIGNYINDEEKKEINLIKTTGVFGLILGGLSFIDIATIGASMICPPLVFAFGGVLLLSSGYLIFDRQKKGKEKIYKDYILEYKNILERKIEDKRKELIASLQNSVHAYIKKIEEINDLQLENLDNYINKKKEFDKNINDLIYYIRSLSNN